MAQIVQISLSDQVVGTLEFLVTSLVNFGVRPLVAGLQDDVASLLNQDYAVVDQVAQVDDLFFL